MSKDINTITISGNLVADPEMRYTASDLAVTDLRIASNRPIQVDDGWDSKATFVTVTAWRDLAERVEEAFGKGDRVIVNGYLELDEWENDEGEARSRLKIVASNVQPMGKWGDFLDGEEEAPKPKRRSNGRSSKKGGRSSGSRRPRRSRSDDMDVDDIPF